MWLANKLRELRELLFPLLMPLLLATMSSATILSLFKCALWPAPPPPLSLFPASATEDDLPPEIEFSSPATATKNALADAGLLSDSPFSFEFS